MGRLTHCIAIVLAIFMISDAHTSATRPALRIWNIYTGELLPVIIDPGNTVGKLKEKISEITQRKLPVKILMTNKAVNDEMFEKVKILHRATPIDRIKLNRENSILLPDDFIFTHVVLESLFNGNSGLIFFPGELLKPLDELAAEREREMAEKKELEAKKAQLAAELEYVTNSIGAIQRRWSYIDG